MKSNARSLIQDTRGSIVEYVIIAGLIALVCIAAFTKLGTNAKSVIERIGNDVGKI